MSETDRQAWKLSNTYTVEIYKAQPLCRATIFDSFGGTITQFWFDAKVMEQFVKRLRELRRGSAS